MNYCTRTAVFINSTNPNKTDTKTTITKEIKQKVTNQVPHMHNMCSPKSFEKSKLLPLTAENGLTRFMCY